MEPAYKLLTVEEFFDSCPNDERHYQLIGGVIVAMAPPAIPSLREILYVESERVADTIYRRDGDGWDAIEISGPDARPTSRRSASISRSVPSIAACPVCRRA